MATYQHPTGGKRKPANTPVFASNDEWRKDRRNRLLWAKRNPDRPTLKMTDLDGNTRTIQNPYYTKPAAGQQPTRPAAGGRQAGPPGGTTSPPAATSGQSDLSLPDYDDGGVLAALGSSQSGFGGGPDLSGVFKAPAALNVSQLMSPAVRLLDRQRGDAQAARDKASEDLKAFNDYLARSQSATQQGLGHQLSSIAGDARSNRMASLANVSRLTQGAVAAAGGNADLLNAGGMTAATQGASFLQNAQNAANENVANTQATLATRQADQNRVSNALSAGLPIELARSYNESMSGIRDRESELIDRATELQAEDVLSQREYASNQAAQSIAAWTAQQEYAGEEKDRAIKVLTARESERTKRLIASINNRVKREIEQGKLDARDADRRSRELVSKLNRESRENIEAYKQEAIAARSGPQANINQELDKLAASEALDPADLIAYGSQRGTDLQRKAALRFVNRARNQYGRGAVPWPVMNALVETHFPGVSEDPQLGQQLKAIWGG